MPAPPGNVLALRHGARSERQIGQRAAVRKRRFLRQTGLRVADLDPIGRGHLDLYLRAATICELYDAWIEQHGLVDEKGNSPGFMATYVAAQNAAGRHLARLEGHLRARNRDAATALRDYLDGEAAEAGE